MEIEYPEEDDYLDSVTIDGQTFEFEDENLVTIPSKILADVETNKLREGITINVCEQILDNVIHVSTSPYSISRI